VTALSPADSHLRPDVTLPRASLRTETKRCARPRSLRHQGPQSAGSRRTFSSLEDANQIRILPTTTLARLTISPLPVASFLVLIVFCGGTLAAPLHQAAGTCDVAAVQRIIDQGAAINEPDPGDQSTPLYYAVYANCTEAVKVLLAHGADPNTGKHGVTPLAQAAGNGNTDILKLLLAAGADINGTTVMGITALARACGKCQLGAVMLLAEKGANLESGKGTIGTPLSSATKCPDIAILRFLVAQGADIRATDMDGKTAKDIASFFGNAPAVQYLDSISSAKTAPSEKSTAPDEGRLTYTSGTLRFSFDAPAGWHKFEGGSGAPLSAGLILMGPTATQGHPTFVINDTTAIPKGWTLESHREAHDKLAADGVLGFFSQDPKKQPIDGYQALAWETGMYQSGSMIAQYHVALQAHEHIIDMTMQSAVDDYLPARRTAEAIVSSIKFAQ